MQEFVQMNNDCEQKHVTHFMKTFGDNLLHFTFRSSNISKCTVSIYNPIFQYKKLPLNAYQTHFVFLMINLTDNVNSPNKRMRF